MSREAETVTPAAHIVIKGAGLHNLKNVSLALPKGRLIVITGLSGSGKSSLAFDTLYAEGQRRYVESLSAYARQFLGRLDKPKVDFIKGLTPAIAIEQKVNTTNPRSTVGTSTELYDYLKVLYARIGKTFSPVSGGRVQKHSVSDVVKAVKRLPEGNRVQVCAPVVCGDRTLGEHAQLLSRQGYARIELDGEPLRLDDIDKDDKRRPERFSLVVDRLSARSDDDFLSRLSDSVQAAFYEGRGHLVLDDVTHGRQFYFSNRFSLDGMDFIEPSTALFSFNNPYGACPVCEGYGSVIGIDEDRVIPDKTRSVYQEAIVCWRGEKMSKWRDRLIETAEAFDFPIHRPIEKLTPGQRELLWTGNAHFEGLQAFFDKLEEKSYKVQNRVMLSRYRGKTRCSACSGKRLRAEATYVKVGGKALTELVNYPIAALSAFFKALSLSEFEAQVARRLLVEIRNRLAYLERLGLGYLTLNRMSSTLSGGESQRINLATSLGSSLVGSTYVLDEPSIGLHPRDTDNLISVLRHLRDLGNTVVVVEHDDGIIASADYLVDMGPEAGERGGEVVFAGTLSELRTADTLTAQYLSGERRIPIPTHRRPVKDFIQLSGARAHNLKDLDVRFPLGAFSVVTGVSGSGKSTLLRRVLCPALRIALGLYSGEKPGVHRSVSLPEGAIENLEFIDQNPVGKSARSNPVTYIKAYDDIRSLFAAQPRSLERGYKASHFSFNVDGGRCETCKGEGEVTIEMQFMADVHLVCESCLGKRFKKPVLDVCFKGKNIHQVLEMTLDQAIAFFRAQSQRRIADKLQPLQDVGLGYVKLGQPSSTLSGGEAQRIKLASFLTRGQARQKTLFIFDEPSTGLHFHDVEKLLRSFEALLDYGNTLIVIEHNLEIIKVADWLVDLGPGGGEAGGTLLYEGPPEGIRGVESSAIAPYLIDKLEEIRG